MKQLKTLLTLLVVSICSVHSAWADRVAPELPNAFVAPESGESYYIYNVLENRFLSRSTTNVSLPALDMYGQKFTFETTNYEGEYTLKFIDKYTYYLKLRNEDEYTGGAFYGTANYVDQYLTIAESINGYTIQRSSRSPYYVSGEFLGYDGTLGDRVSPSLTEGSIHWKFMSVEETDHYFAQLKLFTALEKADTYHYYVASYDEIYNNPLSTTEELEQAQENLNEALNISINYVSPEWTDYSILFQNTTENKWTLSRSNIYAENDQLRWYLSSTDGIKTSALKGTVIIDEAATLVYDYTGSEYSTVQVYLDGELVQTVRPNNASVKRSYYIELPIGIHDITWKCTTSGVWPYQSEHILGNIGIENTPTIAPATTTVEGQLGTEILKLIDNVADVRKIVISGVIGADDWTTIGLMKNVFTIDMSGVTAATDIPNELMRKTKMPFLHSIKLPHGLKEIGNSAFYGSDIEDEITFPEGLKTIGSNAFQGSKIKTAYLPNTITTIQSGAFNECRYLENVSWPASVNEISGGCFSNCINLQTFEIPEGVTEIGGSAFYNALLFNPRFPSTLNRIGAQAFSKTATDRVVIHENLEVFTEAFSKCPNLEYIEFPTTFFHIIEDKNYSNNNSLIINGCSKLKDVYLKCPTVVTYTKNNFFSGFTLSDINLHVPDFLVNAYKLDPYWYQCNVVGFNTADVTDWRINNALMLGAGQRLEGTPNIAVSAIAGASITLNGDDPMTINNFSTEGYGYRSYYTNNAFGMVISNTNNVSIQGDYNYKYYTQKNYWYFITLPFDVEVSNITPETGSKAVRYYDGAARAEQGTGSSWKNYAQNDIIPAGTGFIYQTSQDTWSTFKAENNASKQYVFSKNEFVKELEANPSEVTANKGWNLVGNPWLSYYNIHKLNFTAPITVWNVSNRNYSAYSIIDDDYAILPSQAFFVQCPDEVNSISFPIDGRQLTDVIESQVGARPYGDVEASERKLIDIELSSGELSDKTRFVLNPKAKMDYETSCDASKFFSMDAEVPQIYTLQNGVQMAINERPAGDGIIKLGVVIPASSTYTIKSERNMLQEAVLVDKMTGAETNLSTDTYTFSADYGMNENRFELHLSAGETTGIENIKNVGKENEIYYNLNGQQVSAPQKGIYVVNGKKVIKK